MVLHLLLKPKENTILSLYNSVQGQVATHRATGTFGNKSFHGEEILKKWHMRLWVWNSNMVSFLQNTEKMTFSILDVYPPKFDRMKLLIWPPESSHPGASFGARFGHDSLCKTTSFLWNTEKQQQYFQLLPLKDRSYENVKHTTG